uniref:Uncharacterized protein n=1 Tax=Vitrella brassicaformis TaxID=1169539 RepID=A0A7S1K4Q3_9ALVE
MPFSKTRMLAKSHIRILRPSHTQIYIHATEQQGQAVGQVTAGKGSTASSPSLPAVSLTVPLCPSLPTIIRMRYMYALTHTSTLHVPPLLIDSRRSATAQTGHGSKDG